MRFHLTKLCLLLMLPIAEAASVHNSLVLCTGPSTCTFPVPDTNLPVNYSGSQTIGGVTLSLQGMADAPAGFLSLKASESYTQTGPSNAWTQANTVAGFTDELTINAPGRSGQQGELLLAFAVTGSQSSNGAAEMALFGAPGAPTQPQGAFATAGNTIVFQPFQFTFGQQFELNVRFGAVLFLGGNLTSGFADYFHTATLTGFEPLLADGTTPVLDATVSSTSGVSYEVTAIAPEPSSCALIALGGAALAAARRRYKTH